MSRAIMTLEEELRRSEQEKQMMKNDLVAARQLTISMGSSRDRLTEQISQMKMENEQVGDLRIKLVFIYLFIYYCYYYYYFEKCTNSPLVFMHVADNAGPAAKRPTRAKESESRKSNTSSGAVRAAVDARAT